MHLIIRDFPDDLAEELRTQFQTSAASKAVTEAAKGFVAQTAQVARLQARVAELEMAVRVQRQVIEGARVSASALLDHVAQGDLLTRV
ncbi:hypothetical protein Pfra02_44660 [Pseudomonas fragi]|nr:hypothetical protein Pfra02_44660 [Pseudomonas fragi]